MVGFALRLLVSAIGLWTASAIVPGLQILDLPTLAIAALLLGLVNALVRPVIFILTLPLTIATLGLFIFVLNASLFAFVSLLLHGFIVRGFWAALEGSMVVSFIGWLASPFIGKRGPLRRLISRRR